MSEIVKNPRIMEKLQNEIRSCIGRKSKVHDLDIDKMTYLKMVMKETLRLHSPPSFFDHPGMCKPLSNWRIRRLTRDKRRDPRIWKERPTEFWPEWFENFEVDFMGKLCEMVPFGGGRRACPGYNLGISTVELMIVKLLSLFDWEMAGGVKNQDLDMEEDGLLLIRRKTPLCLVPIKQNCLGEIWEERTGEFYSERIENFEVDFEMLPLEGGRRPKIMATIDYGHH
ncbi:cytochrome P450-like protein [Artemisia annua]|uniref:Cytochrome P450-like protein n=1 Tax=Artemisia annua TaxID=35608 RepID=A0A2U1NWD2_ARTAN|nr:cytochrome P450-like protein [Artemisia annua]